MEVRRDQGAWVHPTVVFKGSAHIGFCSCVGYGAESDVPTRIGDGVTIGAFCVIAQGALIEDGVEIDHYCRISEGARIGRGTRILYAAQVFDDVSVGEDCIIGGDLVDRTIVEDKVTYSGNMAHGHRDPTGDWDATEEPSPIIKKGSIVGVGAIIVGGLTVGPEAYVGAGEIVRCDVPRRMVLLQGQLRPLADYRGMIKVRE